MRESNYQLAQGTIIGGRYSIIRNLGQGGMASVYLAQDLDLGTNVALKLMRDELTDDPEFIKRFATEARAAASLDNPNIVRVLDYGQDGRARYIVQEYVEGRTLKELIREHGHLDYRLATPLMIQIGLALEHAHQRGIIHRDIKPQNILITPDMVAKVTDFGIARTSDANTITLTGGMVIGSVHYFSPEQARGGTITTRSDLYSLGVVFYEMLTGQLPFDGESSVAVAIKHLQETPEPPSTHVRSLPPALDDIVNKAMQKNPDGRYQSAREFVDELDAFMIDPNGVYGVIPQSAEAWDGSTSAIGLQKQQANYNKLREIEHSYNKRRTSRYRDTALVFGIVAVALVLVAVLVIWLVQRFDSPTEKPNSELILPNFVGEYYDEVLNDLEELRQAGLEIQVNTEVDETAEIGIILRQDPESDGTVRINPANTVLTIIVSQGQDSIPVPDVSGMSTLAAEEILTNEGFHVLFRQEFSETVQRDNVISTIPQANSLQPYGATITIIASSGSSAVQVPDITNQSLSQAIQMLEESNLVLGGQTTVGGRSIPDSEKVVITQTPAAYSTTESGSRVSVLVGTREDYTNYFNPTPVPPQVQIMPQLVGKNMTEAYTLLSKVGIKHINTSSIGSSEANALDPRKESQWDSIYIIQQSIAAGSDFTTDTVDVVYGSKQDYQNFLNPTPIPTDPTTPPTTIPPNTDPDPDPDPDD